MFQESSSGTEVPVIVVPSTATTSELESHLAPEFISVRHLIFGPRKGLTETIKHLHRLKYAEFNDWSQPQPAGKTGEFVTVLIKKLRL